MCCVCSNIVPFYVPIALPPSVVPLFAQYSGNSIESGKCRTLFISATFSTNSKTKDRVLQEYSVNPRGRIRLPAKREIASYRDMNPGM